MVEGEIEHGSYTYFSFALDEAQLGLCEKLEDMSLTKTSVLGLAGPQARLLIGQVRPMNKSLWRQLVGLRRDDFPSDLAIVIWDLGWLGPTCPSHGTVPM